MSNGIDLITLALAKKGGGVTPEALAEALATKQNTLTAGTNIDITNNVISSNQPTAPNPYKLTFTSGKGTEAYDGSLPKMITLEKLNGATKDFVNSSIATNTAFFKGTFDSFDDLPTTDVTNNDYAFVVGEDEAGNTTYTRYKYNAEDTEWMREYVLNNSSFTAEQWETIQSGITEDDVTQIETNRSDIADIRVNMPDSPEDVNAQPKSLIIESEFDGEDITVTDSRYIEEGTVKYSQLYSDSMTAFNGGTDVVLRMYVGEDIVVDLKCNCYVVGEDGSQLVFEGHNVAAVIIVTMRSDSVNFETAYNIEPSDSLVNADDDELTTAKAQKDYFQTKITSLNKIAYSNISGTPTLATVATTGSYKNLNDKPTIPTVPSNLVLGYNSSGSATAFEIRISSSEPPSGTASNVITLVTG